MSLPRPSPLQNLPSDELDGVDEATWLDVIHKMDEVYSRLVADEIELEEKNTQLEHSQQFIFSLLSAMSDVLIACNEDGLIEETNAALRELVGLSGGPAARHAGAGPAGRRPERAALAAGDAPLRLARRRGGGDQPARRRRPARAGGPELHAAPRQRGPGAWAACWWAGRWANSSAPTASCAMRTTR